AIASQGKTILGGDVAFTLVQRRANTDERAFLSAAGTVSEVAALRGIARKADNSDGALVEVKAVDDTYPLYGVVALRGGGALSEALAMRDGAFGAAVEDALLVRLGLKVGDPILLGKARLFVAAIIEAEP